MRRAPALFTPVGNAAGQAAIHLAHADQVTIIVRDGGLGRIMIWRFSAVPVHD